MSTFDIVVELIAKEIGKTTEEVQAATSLVELDVDSLDMIAVIMAAEEQLNVLISDRRLASVTSLEGLVDIIDEALFNQALEANALKERGPADTTAPENVPYSNDTSHAVG